VLVVHRAAAPAAPAAATHVERGTQVVATQVGQREQATRSTWLELSTQTAEHLQSHEGFCVRRTTSERKGGEREVKKRMKRRKRRKRRKEKKGERVRVRVRVVRPNREVYEEEVPNEFIAPQKTRRQGKARQDKTRHKTRQGKASRGDYLPKRASVQ
jgi:hypothetical protein